MQRQGFCQNRILGVVCQPLFGVPPVEKRPILKHPLLRNLIFCYYDRNSTEAYLYLKICLLNLFLNLPLIALFWFSYLQHAEIDIGFLHIVPDAVRPIAPQLIVVSTPPLNKTFEHMRGPPTLLGWCPTRRRYVQ